MKLILTIQKQIRKKRGERCMVTYTVHHQDRRFMNHCGNRDCLFRANRSNSVESVSCIDFTNVYSVYLKGYTDHDKEVVSQTDYFSSIQNMNKKINSLKKLLTVWAKEAKEFKSHPEVELMEEPFIQMPTRKKNFKTEVFVV